MYRITFIIVFTIVALSVFAADQLEKAQVDAATYRYYTEGNWKALIEAGREAERAGIDFYYLQLRMGTAYYQLGNYRMAAKYFTKAYHENPSYEYARQMLENSLKFSGSDAELNQICKMDKVGNSTYLNPSKVSEWTIIAEGGHFFDADNYTVAVKDLEPSTQILAFEKSDNTTYSQLTARRFVGSRLSVSLGHSYILHNQQSVAVGGSVSAEDFKTTQNQLYGSLNALLGWGIALKASGQYMNQKSSGKVYDAGSDRYTWTDYSSYDSTISGGGGRYTIQVYDTVPNIDYSYADFYAVETNVKEYALDVHLKKQTPYCAIGIGYSSANLSRWKQQQVNASVDVYPLGNLNTYYHGYYSYRMTDEPGTDNSSTVLLNNVVGQKLNRYLWAEAYYHYGTVYNYVDESAYHIFNGRYSILRRMGLSFIVPLEKVSIMLGYQYQLKENEAFIYTVAGSEEKVYAGRQTVITNGPQGYYDVKAYPYEYRNTVSEIQKTTTTIQYANHLINGGIIWKL